MQINVENKSYQKKLIFLMALQVWWIKVSRSVKYLFW